MSHFIIATDELSKDESTKISDYVKSLKVAWWHWIDGLWLVSTNKKEISTSKLLDDVEKIVSSSNPNIIVMEVDPITWSGYGPSNNSKNMFSWIHRNWNSEQ